MKEKNEDKREADKKAKKEVSNKIGLTFRTIREKKGYSQEELADLCGLHRTYMGSLERGESNVTVFNLIRVAEKLNIKASEILEKAGF